MRTWLVIIFMALALYLIHVEYKAIKSYFPHNTLWEYVMTNSRITPEWK